MQHLKLESDGRMWEAAKEMANCLWVSGRPHPAPPRSSVPDLHFSVRQDGVNQYMGCGILTGTHLVFEQFPGWVDLLIKAPTNQEGGAPEFSVEEKTVLLKKYVYPLDRSYLV